MIEELRPMRERIQLMRVSHPILGQYEADFLYQETEGKPTYTVYLTVDKIDPVLIAGERIVMTWLDDPSKHARAKIQSVMRESAQDQDEWETFQLTLEIQSQSNDLRHYPRLVGGFKLFYSLLDDIENVEDWLERDEEESQLQHQGNFTKPLDDLLNFSVSGLSFETQAPLDISTVIACAIIQPDKAELIKCLAKVTRCAVLKDDPKDFELSRDEKYYQIAVHFVSPPQILTQALTEFTLRLQRRETEGVAHEI
jgi:hypothetical protein